PLGAREIPHEAPRVCRNRQPRLPRRAPQAREHTDDDHEKHHAAVQLGALVAAVRGGDAGKRNVFRHDTPLASAFAYIARMTTSSGASSIDMSRITPWRSAASTTDPSDVTSASTSSSVR